MDFRDRVYYKNMIPYRPSFGVTFMTVRIKMSVDHTESDERSLSRIAHRS